MKRTDGELLSLWRKHKGPATVRGLADAWGISKAAAHYRLRRMVDRGLVVRVFRPGSTQAAYAIARKRTKFAPLTGDPIVDCWSELHQSGVPPTVRHVAKVLGISRTTVSNTMRRARSRGKAIPGYHYKDHSRDRHEQASVSCSPVADGGNGLPAGSDSPLALAGGAPAPIG